jgi:2-succinyl-6-hydroxy-2,4-cyclohexadiene-1-carboxylate synthase
MAPTVILLHGFTHTGASWDPVRTALGESYRAIAPDIRGHGAASDTRPISLEAVIEDIEALAPESFTLTGYSMGGRIALHTALALAMPKRVERLILIGASPGIGDGSERGHRRRADNELAGELEDMTIEAFAERWAQTSVLADQPAHVQAAAHADRLRSTPAGLAEALRQLGAGALPSIWKKLTHLTMPVTLVVGERDAKFVTIAGQMARAIPTVEVVAVPGVGHAVHLEAPEAVAEIITREVITGGTSR